MAKSVTFPLCVLLFCKLFQIFCTVEIVQAEDTFSDSTSENVKSTCHHPHVTTYLQKLAQTFPNITKLISIGNSTEGRELWTLILKSDPEQERPLLKPQIKFVGNINGNSGPACVILLKLIQSLVENYGTNEQLKLLMDNVEIHILPNFNPDGYAKSVPGECFGRQGRLNGNNVDLNRNFPDAFQPDDSGEVDSKIQEPETMALMNWMKENSFVMSGSVIGGAMVVSYPWDSENPKTWTYGRGGAHRTPDDETFQTLARNYVGVLDESNSMDWYCPSVNRIFPEGFINGADWHSVSGSMLDYNYFSGTFELLICLSCCRNDNHTGNLEDIWHNHQPRLLTMIESAALSLRGQVVESTTGIALDNVQITKEDYRRFDDRETMPFFTNSRGEFWRIVLPGKYKFKFLKIGYENVTVTVEISENAPQLSIRMEPLNKSTRRRKTQAQIPELVQMSTKIPNINTTTPNPNPNVDKEEEDASTKNGEDATLKAKVSTGKRNKKDKVKEQSEMGNDKRFNQVFSYKTPVNFSNLLDTSAMHELGAVRSLRQRQQRKESGQSDNSSSCSFFLSSIFQNIVTLVLLSVLT